MRGSPLGCADATDSIQRATTATCIRAATALLWTHKHALGYGSQPTLQAAAMQNNEDVSMNVPMARGGLTYNDATASKTSTTIDHRLWDRTVQRSN